MPQVAICGPRGVGIFPFVIAFVTVYGAKGSRQPQKEIKTHLDLSDEVGELEGSR